MTPLRLLLNSEFTGANAFIALAQHAGLCREAGLALDCTPGRGAYTAAPRLAAEGFDAAYGDIHALIDMAAHEPSADLPVAVYMVHQQAPSCITVAQDGGLQHPADLAGRALVGHASDVALRTFPAFARSTGLDIGSVQVRTADAPMADLLQGLLAGDCAGVFGYLTTHTAALAGLGLHAAQCVRFLPYRDHCSLLYGSALMVSPRLLRDAPATVQALVQVMRAGLQAARVRPAAAIDAVLALRPGADRAIEAARWAGTLWGDIAAPRESGVAWPAAGAVDPARLQAGIDLLADAAGWAHRPAWDRVMTQRFL
ncbi:MAG: ABC transporter substrate-binding protein [Rhodoferax sp.]|jgi:NitT/TauT family transport system substrate-binding protein|nr:ABC transporter substrate-binding protein [Rhodoferax sp.]